MIYTKQATIEKIVKWEFTKEEHYGNLPQV